MAPSTILSVQEKARAASETVRVALQVVQRKLRDFDDAVHVLEDALATWAHEHQRSNFEAALHGQGTLPKPLWKSLLLASKPETAYRVIFKDSWTVRSQDGGLQALRQLKHLPDETFRDCVQAHINWYSNVDNPFISLFIDREHAMKWGWKGAEKRRRRSFELWIVSLSDISRIYSMKTLIQTLGITTRLELDQYESELLVVHRVPGSAIRNKETYGPIPEFGKYS